MGEQAAAAALKVTAVPIVSALGQDKEADDLEVLVRVEAPRQVVAKHPPIDLVAVVDVSGSMGWSADPSSKKSSESRSRMDCLKEALKFIVKELHDDDRLAVVQFNGSIKDSTPLSPISGGGRESALRLVDSLIPDGGTVFKPALEEAASILQQDHGDGKEIRSSRRVPFIIFLSDGEESAGWETPWEQVINAESDHSLREVLRRYPVHTFGFSSSHDPMPLLAMARVSGGTYSYIDQGLDKITDAFAVCLGGLTTVVAVDATIALSAAPGVTIVDIDSGGYSKRIKEHGASGEVCIPVLYKDEVKNFIVHLRLPRAAAAGEQVILTAGSTYFVNAADHYISASTTTTTGENNHQLSIERRPAIGGGGGQQRDEAVLKQATRFKLLSLLEKLPKDKELRSEGGRWAERLMANWSELKNSYGLSSSSFDEDVEMMVSKLAAGSGQAYVCSYVSSHQMERATTMGSPGNIAVCYMTPAMTRKLKKAEDVAAAQPPNGQAPSDPHPLPVPPPVQPPPPPVQPPHGGSNAKVPPRSWKQEWLSSASWLSSVTSGAWKNGERVKVEAFKGRSSKEECTPVLVRVTAGTPWRRPRTPVDIVAVLNISSGMKGNMERMQEAMAAIVSNLDNNDRLSLVLLEDVASEAMGLVRMDSKGRVTASDTIFKVITSRSMFRECGENLSKEALETVRRQIVTASSEAAQDRLRCVMLVSGSQDQDKLIMEDWIAVSKEHSFQFHAFNLVAQHDAGRFLRVADQGAGTYHYLADANIITDAFTAFVGGLKSVVATSVKLSLKAEAGFSISSVETGGHYCWWDGSSEHGIHIADMHAGEQRSFMVYLRGAAAVREQEAAVTDENSKLLTIHAEYLQGSSKKTLRRPCLLLRGKDDDVAMKSEVAAEMVRVKLVKQVKEMVAKAEAHELMKDKWEMMRASAEYEDARGTALLELIEKDVDEMMKKPQCQPHMVSWLSCHWWQRATAMPHYTRAFSSRRARTTSSNGAIALGIAGVVLVCFVMLMLMLRRPTGITPSLNVTAALDVVNHPQWPAMEDDLSLMLGRANEDRITSFFKSASKSDMSQQIDQYLYMAILYAAVLRASYDGTASSSFPEKVVRGQAEAYLQGMLKRTKYDALPALQVASTQDMSRAMSQHLYSTIVQAQVLVTMHAAIPPAPAPRPGHDGNNVPGTNHAAIPPTPAPHPDPPKNNDDDVEINVLRTKYEKKVQEIMELEGVIVKLKIQIEEMQNCCQLANRCGQHVKELGGSVDYFGDYVKKTTYSFELFEHKELSSALQAVEHGHQKIKELGFSVGDDGNNKVDGISPS